MYVNIIISSWLDTLEILNFDAVSFAVPGRCAVVTETKKQRNKARTLTHAQTISCTRN